MKEALSSDEGHSQDFSPLRPMRRCRRLRGYRRAALPPRTIQNLASRLACSPTATGAGCWEAGEVSRFYGLEEKTTALTTLLCAIQHVLAMFVGIITPPLIIASALDLNVRDTSFLVSMALFTSGLTTLVQVRRLGPFGSGLLSVQGTSFTFVPLAIQAGQAGGLPLILGLTLAGSPFEMVLSRFIGLARRLFPPVVTGSVVTLIGLSLVRVGITDLAGGAGSSELGSVDNLALGGLITAIILLLHRFGPGLLKTGSIALGLLIGYLVAALLGRVELSAVDEAGWISLPVPLRYGVSFEPVYLIPWLIGYGVTTLESMGDLTATSAVSRLPVTGTVFFRRLQGGVLADGLESFIAGLLNAMPNTTFSQNNGVISSRAGRALVLRDPRTRSQPTDPRRPRRKGRGTRSFEARRLGRRGVGCGGAHSRRGESGTRGAAPHSQGRADPALTTLKKDSLQSVTTILPKCTPDFM